MPDISTPTRPREEGPIARAIEKQTSKIPSDLFLWAALGTLGVGVAMQAMNRKDRGMFLSQMAPTLLLLGVYNKIVKVAGSDSAEKQRATFGE